MSIIKNITIQNVKGYGSPAVVLPVELKTNRINLLFAPNGTGKTSLVTAFNSLTNKMLDVRKNNKFHKDETLNSSLSLELDGTVLEANATTNSISKSIVCRVINCATEVHTTHKKIGSYSSVTGYIDVANCIIESVIPRKLSGYSITKIKSLFGSNSKILENLQSKFDDPKFLINLKEIWSDLDKFGKAKSRLKLISDVLDSINTLKGNSTKILKEIDVNWLHAIEQEIIYANIKDFIKRNFHEDNSIKIFLYFFQLYSHWSHNKLSIKDAIARAEYERRRSEFDRNLSLLDTTWKNIHTEEFDGQLIVRFPKADEISNGQRDLLTFIVSIIKFKTQLKSNKKYILLIDEVFDYLDDANLITAQYYLTTLLDINKGNLFLCIFSHLNPFTFRSYVFSDKKINPQYLKNTKPSATVAMMDFISFRERMHQEGRIGNKDKLLLYQNLSHDLFHYNPVSVDYSGQIASFKIERRLNEQWGKSETLHEVLIKEVNSYLSGAECYDPYAVAMALRLRVEKIMYNQLSSQLKQEFINKNKTKNKFDLCIENNVAVPDIYYIVSAIHNEADHLKFDTTTNRYIEKPMVYKLQNNVVLGIIKKIFSWNGSPINTDSID